MERDPVYGVQRRVAGAHDNRLEGVVEILNKAQGASVLDLGCNRGMVSLEFARAGAALVHGCDYVEEPILTARNVFADVRSCEFKFEMCDLAFGIDPLIGAFGDRKWDIVLMLATLHKLRKQHKPETIEPNKQSRALIRALGERTGRYFVWRGTEKQPKVNAAEVKAIDEEFLPLGLIRVHYSALSPLGPAAIWGRKE